jgi:hypothetical protein
VLPVEAAASYVADRPGLGAVLVVSGGPPLVLGEIDFASSNALEATP